MPCYLFGGFKLLVYLPAVVFFKVIETLFYFNYASLKGIKIFLREREIKFKICLGKEGGRRFGKTQCWSIDTWLISI